MLTKAEKDELNAIKWRLGDPDVGRFHSSTAIEEMVARKTELEAKDDEPDTV